MVSLSIVELAQNNFGAIALLVYLAWQIHFGRIGNALNRFEDRIERNTLASRYLARANPNADADEIDRLLDEDGGQAPISDDVIIGPEDDRWAGTGETPADGEDAE